MIVAQLWKFLFHDFHGTYDTSDIPRRDSIFTTIDASMAVRFDIYLYEDLERGSSNLSAKQPKPGHIFIADV